VPEIKAIVARAGSDELGLDPMGLNQTDTFMVLQPRDTWRNPDKAWLADQLRAVMVDFPGIGFAFTQPIDMRVSEMLTGVRGDLAIKIYGPTCATLNRLAAEVEAAGQKVPGAEDTFTLKNDGVQYMKIGRPAGRRPIRTQRRRYPERPAALLEGRTVGTVIEAGPTHPGRPARARTACAHRRPTSPRCA
jgi:cobalt-zinc-cadmium resistance protein CzcA